MSVQQDMEKSRKKMSEQKFESDGNMTPEEQSQDLINQAHQAKSGAEIIQLAEKAIMLNPDCSEAYHLLGDHKAVELADAIEWYKKSMDAAQRTLGKKEFEQNKGHFWLVQETRPFMRAKQSYAETLAYGGKYEESVAQYKEMLALNPNDTQGVRYVYGSYLIILAYFKEFKKLLNLFPDEESTAWSFNKALYLFASQGTNDDSVKALVDAHKINEHVLALLTREKPMPKSIPEYYSPGQENEAQYYIAESANAWVSVNNALDWCYAVYKGMEKMKKSRIPNRNRKFKKKKR